VALVRAHATGRDFVQQWLSRQKSLQNTINPSTEYGEQVAEPKFYVNGSAFWGSWGRPQNDGPAIRVMAVIEAYRHQLIDLDEMADLYDGRLPSFSLVKRDLEYVAKHWHEPSFDLWEEVNGIHFFTLSVQYEALVQGASLAWELHDPGAARFYAEQAQIVRTFLVSNFFNGNFLVATLGGQRPDCGTLLGALYTGIYPPESFEVQGTLDELMRQLGNSLGVGRYPGDVYDGVGISKGNAWFICTIAAASVTTNHTLQAELMETVRTHALTNGSLSEQFDMVTGQQRGARDLTWSYAELIQYIHNHHHYYS